MNGLEYLLYEKTYNLQQLKQAMEVEKFISMQLLWP